MAKEIKILDEVTFQYKVSDNYAVYSADGAHGGLNAKGDIIINFFSERQPIPRREKYKVEKDGSLNPQPIEVEATTDIIRNVNFGVALKPDVARSVANWLLEKASELDEIVVAMQEKGKQK